MRLLFSSIHCYLDPSSGAALCTRELLELLAGRGADCRMLTTGILDSERETSVDEVFATVELPAQRFQAELGMGRAAEVIELSVNGVRVTLMPTSSSRVERSPDPRESVIFLELAEEVFDRFRPAVLLTYGDHPSSFSRCGGRGGWLGQNAPGAPAWEEPEALLWCRCASTTATPGARVKPE